MLPGVEGWRCAIRDLIQPLADRLVERGLVAAGIGVSKATESCAVTSGWRNKRRQTPVETSDAWHIGSVGKSFTSTLLARVLSERGHSLDTTLETLAPDLPMHAGYRTCPVRAVLDHSAGIPANFPLRVTQLYPDTAPDVQRLRREHLEMALRKRPRSTPGAKFRYSNLGYTLAGHLVEVLTGQHFDAALQNLLAEPLGLARIGFGAPHGTDLEDTISGHQILPGWKRLISPLGRVADNTPIITPAGRLHMPLDDILRFGAAHVGRDAYLPSEVWQTLHRPHLQNYACGWICQKFDWAPEPVLWHNGSNTYWYTVLMLLPERGLTIAFTTNQGSMFKAERLFFQTAETIVRQLAE